MTTCAAIFGSRVTTPKAGFPILVHAHLAVASHGQTFTNATTINSCTWMSLNKFPGRPKHYLERTFGESQLFSAGERLRRAVFEFRILMYF